MIEIPNYFGLTPAGKKIFLPKDAVTSGFAAMAKRGSGKSATVGVMLEILALHEEQFVVFDPPNAHWGIRYKVDGKGRPNGPSGIDVLIIGGPHGDVKLDPDSGAEIARLVVETGISFVIEMKELTFGQRQKFCCAFANELFRINERPCHLVFEEAQNFLPQRAQFDQQKEVLYAMGRLIAEGRGTGLGFTIVSQRPSKVNKDELTQVDNMLAMKMLGPQDLKAMGAWFEHHLGDKQLRDVIGSIVKFKPGDCYFLTEDSLQEFHVRPRVTYHAGRTPKAGERAVNPKRIKIGEAVERLKKLFATKQKERAIEVETLNEAKKRIRDLEVELRKKSKAVVAGVPMIDLSRTAKEVEIAVKKIKLYYEREIQVSNDKAQTWKKRMEKIISDAQVALSGYIPSTPPPFKLAQHMKAAPAPKAESKKKEYNFYALPPKANKDEIFNGKLNGKLAPGAMRALAALAQYYPESMQRSTVKSRAGIKSAGTFRTYVSDLARAGCITVDGDELTATPEGRSAAKNVKAAPQTTKDVRDIWDELLSPGAMKLLDLLIMLDGQKIKREELFQQSQMQSAGTFRTYISDLSRADLIVVSGKDVSANKDSLFL